MYKKAISYLIIIAIFFVSFDTSKLMTYAEDLTITADGEEAEEAEDESLEVTNSSDNSDSSSDESSQLPISGNATPVDQLSVMKDTPVIYHELTKDDIVASENAGFILYLNENNSTFKIKDKKNGYIWSSSPVDPNYNRMSSIWKNFSKSMIVLDYINSTGSIKQDFFNGKKSKDPKYEITPNGFQAIFDFGEAKVKVTVNVTITETGFSIDIPDDKIENKGKNKISTIYTLPFFGAVYQDDISGYMFVPDGSGALINYSKSKEYVAPFEGRIYGKDYSVYSSKTNSDIKNNSVALKQIYLPVFGAAHGKNHNAFLADIVNGAEYCNVVSSPAGAIIDYNWTCARFIYNEIYWQPIGGSEGFNATTQVQNNVNAKVEYTLLSDNEANYSGMAVAYKNKLIGNGELSKKITENNSDNNIPIKIDAFMGETKKGTFFNKLLIMTKAEDIIKWKDYLTNVGINNTVFSVVGGFNGGVSANPIDNFSLDSKIGSKKDFKKLSEKVSSEGGMFVLQKNILSGFISQISKSDMIYNINGSFSQNKSYKLIYPDIFYADNKKINSIANSIGKFDYTKNLALDEIGNSLYSNYNKKLQETRTQSLEETVKNLEIVSNYTDNLMLESPNKYALKYSNSAYNVPDGHSTQIYENETVPFYQIVLSGNVDMFAPYANYRSDDTNNLLKLIDFNMYPSYIMTEQYSSEFINSNTKDIYASRFEDWQTILKDNYTTVNNVLKNVRGKSIINREVIDENIILVTYNDNSKIVINYSNKEFNYNNKIVDSKSALYTKGE